VAIRVPDLKSTGRRYTLEPAFETICNLYSITTNQAAVSALFRVVNRYVGNLAPMPGVFPGYSASVIRNNDHGTELAML
jgi:hypothetical protein